MIDYLIQLHLSFFFTFLPLCYSDNTEYTDQVNRRDIADMGKTRDQFEIKIMKVK